MIAYTEGTCRPSYLWGAFCKSWGLHYVAQTKEEAKREEKRGRSTKLWCGPHKVVKLFPKD